jgi:hypothetical protein
MASKDKIANDATLADLTGPAAKREEYVRRVLGNLYAVKSNREQVVMRIGVAGRGIAPHYKLEAPVDILFNGHVVGATREAFRIFHGTNHKEMTAFDVQDVRDEHWSSKVMTFVEVEQLFGNLRARPRRG